ncbi:MULTISPECIES: DUF6099 family protein [Kitasatospora]|uniref:Uncharacterized protein n=2 Tax=Kitasatospora TaxID=2063 RepID=A0ABT1IYV8_9ACTN|nr:DUF6099 family protein [Kitasatospora paracochleata]MCP2310337.1 hypothetical protein [Kitasatospora paracochleata]
MDALRLIKTARHALAEARSVPDTLHEAWQAGLLTEAIGARIAEREGEEFGTLGQLLCDAGGHAASCLDQPPEADTGDPVADWSGGGGRAERLDGLGELEPLLLELGVLLNEVSETLVVLACGADTESLYWCCIDGVDAAAECKDLVAELLRLARRRSEAEESDGVAVPSDGAAVVGDVASAAGCFGAPSGGRASVAGGLDGAGVSAAHGAEGAARAARRAERVPAMLVVPLGPPVVAACGQPRTGRSVGSACSVDPVGSAGPSARAPEERRSESSPARSVLIDASSSCICSSSVLGRASAPPMGAPVAVACAPAACVAMGGSVQGSDMKGPLQLGGRLGGAV